MYQIIQIQKEVTRILNKAHLERTPTWLLEEALPCLNRPGGYEVRLVSGTWGLFHKKSGREIETD